MFARLHAVREGIAYLKGRMMVSANFISCFELYSFLARPDAPIVLDARIDGDFHDDPRLIPTSRRIRFNAVDDEIANLEGQSVVVVCQKGKKISQGAAALLRNKGGDARVLEGGHFGWRDAGYPFVDALAYGQESGEFSKRWVVADQRSLDQHLCCWLIKRFVCGYAEFLFVEPDQVALVAEKFAAVILFEGNLGNSHRLSETQALLKKLQMCFPVLDHFLSCIQKTLECDRVREADTFGIEAIFDGLTGHLEKEQYSLEAGFVLIDALYGRFRHDEIKAA